MFSLSNASESKLEGVHADLVRVVRRAIELTPIDFKLTEGLRTIERQRELVRTKKSKTMNSRHLTGHAIDFVAMPGGKPSYEHMSDYVTIAKAFKAAAAELGVKIECGADWGWDGPHVELDRKVYPA